MPVTETGAVRDDAWDAILELIVSRGRIKLTLLPFDDAQRSTVYRVLREMEAKEWLTRKSDRSSIWWPGEKARSHLTLSERASVLVATGGPDADESGSS